MGKENNMLEISGVLCIENIHQIDNYAMIKLIGSYVVDNKQQGFDIQYQKRKLPVVMRQISTKKTDKHGKKWR